MELDVILS
jgi:calcium-dependent protein kinase